MKDSSSRLKNTLKIGRFLIPYRIYESTGPQVICVNGVQQSMAMWHTFVARFSGKYRIVLFDFPNQGKAKIISGPAQVSLDEQVGILAAVMEKAGVSKDAALCAASWGGVVAVAFASRYPERVKRLILASLGTKANEKMAETIKKGAVIAMHDRDQMARVLLEAFGNNLPARIKRKIVVQFRGMKEEDVRVFSEHGLFVVSAGKLSELVNLKNIKAETTLLYGEKDTIIDLADVKFLASQIPGCQIRIVEGVGHFLHLESERVFDLYAEILKASLRSPA